jgi:hypothetical protein
MRWLGGCSEAAVGEALRPVAPELSGYPLAVGDPGPEDSDPVFWSGTANLEPSWRRRVAMAREHWLLTVPSDTPSRRAVSASVRSS